MANACLNPPSLIAGWASNFTVRIKWTCKGPGREDEELGRKVLTVEGSTFLLGILKEKNKKALVTAQRYQMGELFLA